MIARAPLSIPSKYFWASTGVAFSGRPWPLVLAYWAAAGHPPEFFRGIATRYLEVEADAPHLSPAAVIAKQYGKSINTANGWIRYCRERGLLPAAKGKRPKA